MPIAPWRFPPLCAVLGRACCFKTITREKVEAYTTYASGEWIGFRDAAVGHREGHRVSWSHKTLGWSPYVRSAPQKRQSPPRSNYGPFARANYDAQGLSAYPALCGADLFFLLSRPHQCRLCRADDEQGYRPRRGDLRHGRRRLLLGVCAVRGAEQHHSRKARSPNLDRANHDHMGADLGRYRLCDRAVQL